MCRLHRAVHAFALGSLTLACVARAQNVFSNNSPITIPSSGNAIPYPSTIGVGGLTPPGNITNVVVTLKGLTHPRLSDVDIVLVGPGGQHCELLSDASPDAAIAGADLTFSRTGRVIRAGDALGSGTYAPVNLGFTLENFPGPGPGIVSNTDLAVFDGTSAVGTWSLFIIDDSTGPSATTGSIAGWSIRFNDPIQETVQSGAEFSYQGVLTKNGTPFTGIADLRFSLWNDANSTLPGTQYGGSILRTGVPVSNGVFTVQLDFGSSVFSEKRRFLQVESKVAVEIDFTPIFPRTPVTGVPFAGTTPLAKAATRLDAPDGSPINVVEVDNFGSVKMNAPLSIVSTLDVGATLTANGGITLPATSRSRMYPASAWLPSSSVFSYTLSNNDWFVGSTAAQLVSVVLPLNIPDGAIIREVTIFCEDLSTSSGLTCALRRVQSTGASAVSVASQTTVGSPGFTSLNLTGLNEPTDASTVAHSLLATWTVPATTSQIRIGNVRVKYDITSPLP